MAEHSIVAAIGHFGFWGFSAAFDMIEALEKSNVSIDENNELQLQPIRILLVHPGDIRHILTTLSRRKRHSQPSRAIEFYLLESPVEVLGRNILSLQVLTEVEIPIRQRGTIFMEIFGNCKIQERTSRYIEELGKTLRTLIADNRGNLAGIVDFSLLRYRERDLLEDVFKSYSRSILFDVANLRDHRLRAHYADRFDARVALSDWDWHAHFKETASIIHIKQYKYWRETGIAFEFGDQNYVDPNRTMMAYTEGIMKKGRDQGIKKEVRGLWTDIVVSPYLSYGIDTDTPCPFAENLFEIQNKNTGVEQHRHHTVEVALHSIFSILWELETGSIYRMTRDHDIYSGLGVGGSRPSNSTSGAVGNDQEDDTVIDEANRFELLEDGDDGKGQKVTKAEAVNEEVKASENETVDPEILRIQQAKDGISSSLEGIKIFPMVGSHTTLKLSSKLTPFHAIFVSSRCAQWLQSEEVDTLLLPGGQLAVESAKFLVPLSKTQKEDFNSKLMEFGTAKGWRKIPAPVRRRKREDTDLMDDVIFFSKPINA